MSKSSNLENSVINLSVLREDSRRELLGVLDAVSGSAHQEICLVLEPEFAGPLQHILTEGFSVFKDHHVKEFKELSRSGLSTSCPRVIFLVRPVVSTIMDISFQIKELSAKKKKNNEKPPRYFVYYMPRRMLVCDEVLKKEGVFGSVTIGVCPLDLIPFDDDILSLEIGTCFRDFFVENDKSALLHSLSSSIIKLQSLYGMIPNVKFKGSMSKILWQMMQNFKREQEAEGSTFGVLDPEIDTLVLIDRNVDLLSPMVTPLTYESQLDEIIGIHNGIMHVDSEILDDDDEDEKRNKPPKERKQVPLNLNSTDKFYADIRDLNSERYNLYLQEQIKEVREMRSEFEKNNKKLSIQELRDFVKNVPSLNQKSQSSKLHIKLAGIIKEATNNKEFRDLWVAERTMIEVGGSIYDQLESMIGDQVSLLKVLRLLSIQSITAGGIKANQFDQIRREICQTYGYEVLSVLSHMEKVGFIKRRDSTFSWDNSGSSFSNIRKSLRLINDRIDFTNPNDISFVTSGYAPLSCRLVEHAMKPKGWSTIQDVMRALPGPFGEDSQTNDSNDDDDENSLILNNNGIKQEGFGDRKVMMVYFIGGVSFMEIAALRHIAKQQDCPYDIVIATTKIINGKTLLQPLFDPEFAGIFKNKF